MNHNSRIHSLDSIRGIAALVVLLHHSYMLAGSFRQQAEQFIEATGFPLGNTLSLFVNLFTSGRSAVIIFFVLSGFVLTVSLLKRKQSYKQFLLSRIFRIYPVLFASLVLSYLVHLLIGNNHIISDSINSDWYKFHVVHAIPLTISDLIGHLALTEITPYHTYLNAPLWSLVHEMRISLILPLLVLLFTVNKKPLELIVIGLVLSILSKMILLYLAIAKHVVITNGFIEMNLTFSFVRTIYFLPFFMMGIFLALRREKVRGLIEKSSTTTKYILLLTSIIFLIYYDNKYEDFVDYLRGVGAVLLIALAFSWRNLEKLLTTKILQWLGRISYSLYLVHWLFIYPIAPLLANVLPLWGLVAITIVFSLIAAELMARFVEYPCINLGKKLLHKS